MVVVPHEFHVDLRDSVHGGRLQHHIVWGVKSGDVGAEHRDGTWNVHAAVAQQGRVQGVLRAQEIHLHGTLQLFFGRCREEGGEVD